jgi:hypothetical protein
VAQAEALLVAAQAFFELVEPAVHEGKLLTQRPQVLEDLELHVVAGVIHRDALLEVTPFTRVTRYASLRTHEGHPSGAVGHDRLATR